MSQGPSNANDPSKAFTRPLTTDEVEKALTECGEQLRGFIQETKPLTDEENRLIRKASRRDNRDDNERLPPELRITL